MTRELRFGVVCESVRDGRGWAELARRVEAAGVDCLLVRDHLMAAAFGQQLAPFTALSAAAAVTERLHVGTLVLGNDLRHPAVLAHEAASLHHLSGGRFELGVGAGWYEPEYRAAGIPFDPPGRRIDRLEESLTVLRGLLEGRPVHHEGTFYRIDGLSLDVLPPPRGRVPLLVGAGGPRMLRVAARHADIVGLLPAPITSSDDRDEHADRLPPALERKVAVLRSAAGDRFDELELSALVTITLTSRRRAATEDLIASRGWSGVSVEDVWSMPTVFVGSAAQVCDDLRERRDRYGLTYLVTSESDVATLAEVIAAL